LNCDGDGVEGAGELLGDQVLVDTLGETGDATDTHRASIARAGAGRQRRGAGIGAAARPTASACVVVRRRGDVGVRWTDRPRATTGAAWW
jgi:hypothetical protein